LREDSNNPSTNESVSPDIFYDVATKGALGVPTRVASFLL
jgi:hypothetical protein